MRNLGNNEFVNDCCEDGDVFIRWNDYECEFVMDVVDELGEVFEKVVKVCPFCKRSMYTPDFDVVSKSDGVIVVDPTVWLFGHLDQLQNANISLDDGDEEHFVTVQHLQTYKANNINKLAPLGLMPIKRGKK